MHVPRELQGHFGNLIHCQRKSLRQLSTPHAFSNREGHSIWYPPYLIQYTGVSLRIL